MLGAFLADFHVRDQDVVVGEYQQACFPDRVEEWLRRAEGDLVLDTDIVAAVSPEVSLLVELAGMQGGRWD